MKFAFAAVAGAMAASACCIGPVVFTLLGAGALGAASVRLEPYRPWFIGATIVTVAAAFYSAYGPARAASCEAGCCASEPTSRRAVRVLAWIGALIAALLIAFPYYVGWFV